MTLGNMSRTALFFVTSVFLVVHDAGAAPKPQHVSNLDEVNGTFTVVGSDFGDAIPETPQLWDTVDNREEFKALPSGTEVPTDFGPWTQNGNSWSNIIEINDDGEQRFPGSKRNYYGEAKGYLGWPRAFSGHKNENIYVSWYFKPSVHPNSAGGANKFIRMWDDPSGTNTRIAWTQVLLSTEWISWPGNVNEWNRMEIYFDNASKTVTAWTNGKLTGIASGKEKSDYEGGMTVGLVGFDSNYMENYESMRFWLDDIYASSTIARVEVSDQPNWSNSGPTRELQPPIKWSNSEITVRLNRGKFTSTNKQLYVYVIDAQGSVNEEGVPLSQCLECPKSPSLEIL